MIRSMTGFGEATREVPQGQLRATVKTVNHRFFNAHLRTPSGYERYDAEIQNWLKIFFSRGHVNMTLVLERDRTAGSEELPVLDLDRARHYQGLLSALQDELDVGGRVDLPSILRFGDVFRAPEKGEEESIDGDLIREVVEEAAKGALSMR